MTEQDRLAVVGLGYVGLPVALALARHYPIVGYDVSEARIAALQANEDTTGEVDAEELRETSLRFSADPEVLRGASIIVVAVPTPVDMCKRPDLGPLLAATRTVGAAMAPGTIVVYESTVFPGATEEVCAPVLENASGLARDQFKLAYSPERINPGDKGHSFRSVTKVVSAEDEATLERIASMYERVVPAGVFRAASIKVAEAAKVIENTQRDLNIALMNELAIIFDLIGIRSRDVLEAAGTKWNFNRFTPGLVGGHCIGVDPYYLTEKAEALGYHPQVILAGRRINDGMSGFIAQKLVKLMINLEISVKNARVGLLGITFKENVADFRNSKACSLAAELRDYGAEVLVHDPHASASDLLAREGLVLRDFDSLQELDAVVLAVPHTWYRSRCNGELVQAILGKLRRPSVVIDIKSMLEPAGLPESVRYWCL